MWWDVILLKGEVSFDVNGKRRDLESGKRHQSKKSK